MESALYGVYTLVVLYQKSHLIASLTCSISDMPQLVCKHRTCTLSMKYSIYMELFCRNNMKQNRLEKQTFKKENGKCSNVSSRMCCVKLSGRHMN